MPNLLLPVVGLPTTDEVWIRVAGMLALFLAFYDIQAVRSDLAAFFRWTVYVRSSVIIFMAVFVLLGQARPAIIVFGFIDLAGAIWTAFALKSSETTSSG
ncbi:MAG: hypothetical protein AABZ10_05180 [Nitrospirota bacterium]